MDCNNRQVTELKDIRQTLREQQILSHAAGNGAASPYVNEVIKTLTDNEAFKALNIPAHILWGAVEAELAGGSATAGAVAAGLGELGARILVETVYGKQLSELNEEEKQNLLNASKALAGVASGVVSGGNGAETLANASIGMVVAENAVENNYLKADKAKERFEIENRIKLGIETEEDLKRKEELDKEYIANRQKVITACDIDITSGGCIDNVSEALTVLQGYDQVYPNENWKTYAQILNQDYKAFQELLYDKTGIALDFEQRAKLVAKGKNISIEEARTLLTYLDRYHSVIGGLGALGGAKKLPSVSSAGKPLDELDDFSISVPKGSNANEKQPIVGNTKGYENQTVRLSGGEYRANLYSKNWETASLSEVLDRFVGNSPNITITERGKRI